MSWGDEDEWQGDDDDGSSEVLACPSCRGEVHEDAQQCPQCGDWIIPVDPRDGRRRRLWAIVAILLIGSMVLFVARM